MVNFTKEYANLNDGSTFTGSNYVNDQARFKCNNIITDGSRNEALNAYTMLYNAYNTNEKNAEVKNINLPDTVCHSSSKCPFTEAILTQSDVPNVLAYTEGPGTTNKLYVRDLKFYLDDCGARIQKYDKDHPTNGKASFDSVKNNAINFRDVSYNALVTTRSDLDNKMNEILANNKNSILYEKQSELDATVYSTLLWTVMVTSLIYYVFTKI